MAQDQKCGLIKCHFLLVAIAMFWFAANNSVSKANTLTLGDSARIIALGAEVREFNHSLKQMTAAMTRSSGLSKQLFCLMEVEDQATNISRYLFATGILVQLTSEMKERGDEFWTLVDVDAVLSRLFGTVDNTRSELNPIMGRCSRSRAAYDKAKSLSELASKIKAVIVPLMARVHAKLPPGLVH